MAMTITDDALDLIRDDYAALERENARLRAALGRISRWKDFPPTGKVHPDGKPMAYREVNGFVGEIDCMRGFAADVLNGSR